MAPVIGVEIPDGQLAQLAGAGFDQVPELLEAAGVGYVVLGADRATGASGASLSPTIAGTVFARRTRGLGIVTAASPQRDHPYNIARRLASLDHLTHGRAGWLALREDRATALGQAGRSSWAADPIGAAHSADAVTAARALWRTWPIESLVTSDHDPGFLDESQVRFADHTGLFPTTGPLNVPTTPQGEPLVWWRYEPGDDPHDVGVADVAIVAADDRTAAGRLPESVRLHVRVDGSDAELRTDIAELATHPRVHGVLVRLDVFDLRRFIDRTVEVLAESGVIRLRAESGPALLREYLEIPRRIEPDLSAHRPVFARS
jgi:alkanesulfonate monooxygenase SsuD/methylene tetrahydromethanopterin reductase-like flavin-dependent oxidoreductase (luciferase family)